ncbi:MAG TPA: SDR family oxidoreductase [Urbifossiella sp.]|nr:SDR family oxidoreductase [Urbifossiella sp.]
MNRGLLLSAAGVGAYLAYRALRPSYAFRDRHVVITGGSRGLGLVLARQFAAAGARLSICSRDSHELARAMAELQERGARVAAIECDVADRNRVREFLAVARRQNGPIDVLVNNAGIIQVGPMEAMREEDYDESLRIHFWASLYTSLEVLPEMKARGCGRIVNIASIGGKIAVPHLLPYTVGKFALVGFSNGLREEVARHGIAVTTVCPGLMRTGSHLNARFKGRHQDEFAWFALGGSLPGLSMSAESAARRILEACSRGDAEVVLGLPFKLAVDAWTLFPNLMASIAGLADRFVLPESGGIGSKSEPGSRSHGRLPRAFTRLSDRAAADNNELHACAVGDHHER